MFLKRKGLHCWRPSFGDPAGIRTQDPNIKSVVLYRLSYWILQLCFSIAVAKIGILFEFPKDKRIFYKKRQDKKNTLAPMDALFIVIYPECPVKTFDIFLLNSEHLSFGRLWLSCGLHFVRRWVGTRTRYFHCRYIASTLEIVLAMFLLCSCLVFVIAHR